MKRINIVGRCGCSLQLFKVCDKMWKTLCVAEKTIPISFPQCLSVRLVLNWKFVKSILVIYIFLFWGKLWLQVQFAWFIVANSKLKRNFNARQQKSYLSWYKYLQNPFLSHKVCQSLYQNNTKLLQIFVDKQGNT